MVVLLEITVASVVVFGIWLGVLAWYKGRDYIIEGNFGRRLNWFEKFFDGLDAVIKM